MSTKNCSPRFPQRSLVLKRGSGLPGGAPVRVFQSHSVSRSVAADKSPPSGWLCTHPGPQQPHRPSRNRGRNMLLTPQFSLRWGLYQFSNSLSIPEVNLATDSFSCKMSKAQRTQSCVIKYMQS